MPIYKVTHTIVFQVKADTKEFAENLSHADFPNNPDYWDVETELIPEEAPLTEPIEKKPGPMRIRIYPTKTPGTVRIGAK